LFVSHDLRAVHHISNRIAVMYLGRIVELAPAEQICRQPLMPYTRALVASIPSAAGRCRPALVGELSSSANFSSGCRFRARCPYPIDECATTALVLDEIAPSHYAACIRISAQAPDIDRVTSGNGKV